jgi:small multidrug resistance family-3 protein
MRQPARITCISRMMLAKTLGSFVLTAVADIVGCSRPYVWLKKHGSVWLRVPAPCCLTLCAWLLSFHPTAAGRVSAAYGSVYISGAMLWLWLRDAVRPTLWDGIGVAVSLLGMAIMMLSARHSSTLSLTLRGRSCHTVLHAAIISPEGTCTSFAPHDRCVQGRPITYQSHRRHSSG